MPGTYRVCIGSFEGPFDLLLQLVARHRVDVYEIPLARITDDYLAVLSELEELDLDVATGFLLVAATLLELKAARLLPGEDDPESEELALEARDLLYARLLDYRAFKEAAGHLRRGFDAHAGYVPREVVLEDRYTGLVPDARLDLTPAQLAALAARALAEKPPAQVDVSHLQPVRMTVPQAAVMVTDELQRAGGRASFRELTAGCRHRVEVIVCFLALLELYKLRAIELHQAANFEELTVVASAGWQSASAAVVEEYAAEGEAQA